jgi:hypothetical protein
MNVKYLYKFFWDCGRSGEVEGLFVATEEEVAKLVGENIYLGEVLGKHSEVFGVVEEGDIDKLDLDSDAVSKVSALLGDTWSGYNPLHYYEEENA